MKKIWQTILPYWSFICAPLSAIFFIYSIVNAFWNGAWQQLLIATIVFVIFSGGVIVIGILAEG
jgi:hypothetical protein